MKRYLTIFIMALAMLGITARAFSATNALADKCYQAEVTDISGRKYFPAVKEALGKAEKSINIAMFTIETPLSGKNSKVGRLIDALIDAKNRGVEVEVILDQNVDFVHRGHPSDWGVEIKSARAFKRFKDAGIKVYYDEPERYTHAKCVIVDKKIVILGSTNWTESAFSNSIETNLLVNSAELAEEILSYLKTIKIDESAEKNFEVSGPVTHIRQDVLENPKLMPKMVKMSAMRDFDVYLYLLWKNEIASSSPAGTPRNDTGSGARNDTGTEVCNDADIGSRDGKEKIVFFSFEDVAKYLGIYEGWTVTDYRRQIIRALRNLERRYRLIKFEPKFGKEAGVTLVEIASSSPSGTPRNDTGSGARNDEKAGIRNDTGSGVRNDEKRGQSQRSGQSPFFFELTNDYFNLGWNRELSLRAKLCLLINIYYFQMSDVKPFWSKSIPDLAKQFGGVGRDVIIKGMEELRRKKLIEVKYDELKGTSYDIKSPKMYKLLKLYDPKDLALRLKAVEDKYGREAYGKARKYAEIVFEENNPQIIEDIILKAGQYGDEKIKKAFDIVVQKNTDNPKKSYAYVVGIVENK